MSNSPLSCMRKISPMRSSPRTHAIDTITIHCVVGQVSVEWLCDFFYSSGKEASCNYGIGTDGRICTIVDETDRSWCSSNAANDNRAITIECASDSYEPYAINTKVWNSLIKLCADICQRNGIKQLVWSTDKNTRVNHLNGCNLTVHRDYDYKSCPGDYIYNRMGQIASEVNKILKGEDDMTADEVRKIVAEEISKAKASTNFGEIVSKEISKIEAETSKKEVSGWAKESWDKACASKTFDGKNPRGNLTREQAATVLDRLGLLK